LGKTLGEIERMPHTDLVQWRLLEIREPFGDRRLDFLAARICQLIVASHGDGKTSAMLSSFMPKWE